MQMDRATPDELPAPRTEGLVAQLELFGRGPGCTVGQLAGPGCAELLFGIVPGRTDR